MLCVYERLIEMFVRDAVEFMKKVGESDRFIDERLVAENLLLEVVSKPELTVEVALDAILVAESSTEIVLLVCPSETKVVVPRMNSIFEVLV